MHCHRVDHHTKSLLTAALHRRLVVVGAAVLLIMSTLSTVRGLGASRLFRNKRAAGGARTETMRCIASTGHLPSRRQRTLAMLVPSMDCHLCRAVTFPASSSPSPLRCYHSITAARATPARTRETTSSLALCSLMMSSAASTSGSDQGISYTAAKKKVPITLLSGFLGSGKTSCLTNILENRKGIRVGVIVNDVASVNIDAKLIASVGRPGGGSIKDNNEANGNSNDYSNDPTNPSMLLEAGATVELQNGCACCSLADELLISIEQLLENKNRVFDHVVVELSGVADPIAVRQNWEDATMRGHPATLLANINHIVTVIDASTFGQDWMTWNTAGDRKGWVTEGDDCSAQKKVTELLAEQVEAADVLLMNKMDLVEHDKLQIAATVAKGLNANAKMFEATYGKIPIEGLFGGNTITSTNKGSVENDNVANEHALSHSQQNDHNSEARHAPDCLDESNHHSHAHDHACSDPKCNVSTHHHDHNHHDHSSTSTDDLEISSFVFKASVPFNAGRLLDLLNKWPVPIKDELDIGQMQRAVSDGCNIGEQNSDVRSPFMGVLRSKGFCWLAPSKWSGPGDDTWRHDTAMYWSHAGKHFGITTAGKWWGSLSREQMKGFFTTNKKEFDRIIQEDFVSDEWGDRRQEIVFIGTNLGEDEINNALNKCLLTKAELEKYRQLLRNFEYSTLTSSGPSLFDIGGTDHIDANTR